MNFQDLMKVETADKYIDLAFFSAKKESDKERTKVLLNKNLDKVQKSQIIENHKLKVIGRSLSASLKKIVHVFPAYKNLTPFYKELMANYMDIPSYKKSLGALNWASGSIERMSYFYNEKIRRCREFNAINAYRQQYYGRISSFLKQVKNDLIYLENCRRIMKDFPSVKSMPTVCIAGFPNVGKSTLLLKLSTAKPEIKEYAFTTKQLNIGYIADPETPMKKVQLIDTPGTLNRLEEMNDIERVSYLALKYCADMIIYVFDLTEASAPLEDQEELFNALKKQFKGKDLAVYLSKTDLLDKEGRKKLDSFKKKKTGKIRAEDDAEKIKKIILEKMSGLKTMKTSQVSPEEVPDSAPEDGTQVNPTQSLGKYKKYVRV